MYVTTPMNLDRQNFLHLLHGRTTKIPFAQLHGTQPIWLTGGQRTRVIAAYGAKKAVTLKFSQRQINHMSTHGSGIFDDIINGLGSVVNAVAPIAVPALSNFINRGSGLKLQNIQSSRVQSGDGLFEDIVGGIGSVVKAVAPIANPAIGSWINRGPKKGDGFFDDFVGGLGSVINAVAPIAAPAFSNLITRGRGAPPRRRVLPKKISAGLYL